MAKLFVIFAGICILSVVPVPSDAASSTAELCEMPAVVGNIYCVADSPRWTFNSEDEKCESAGHYAGCSQTKNNFESQEACEKACGDYRNELEKREKTYPAACSLPSRQSGMCLALFYKFYFDAEAGACKPFTYGGCGGNANMFDSAKECEHYCGGGK